MGIPRPEHPNPQLQRQNWLNLNGWWEFETDKSKSGLDRKLQEAKQLSGKILVPFCPESDLSGVGEKDFMEMVWYRRSFVIPEGWQSGRVFLHFGAVDYHARVFVNGQKAGEHKGGYASFCLDITDLLTAGENAVTLCAEDNQRSGRQPRGKQSYLFYSQGCEYTRTTGIWQTVWLEYRPQSHIASVRYYPDPENGQLHVEARITGKEQLTVEAFFEGRAVGSASAMASGNTVHITVPLSEIHLWEVGQGRLYDLVLTYGEDRVESYFGLRSIRFDGVKFLLNGKALFQRLVLDQGFYPDGIYTAPTDEALIKDILLSQAVGFNGARLHEKIFEARFLYHADRLGYLVWGEHANWGLDIHDPMALHALLPEWTEAVERDFNHPAIVGWCPYNETWDYCGTQQLDSNLEIVYRVTKALDPTRPCIDTSGNFHTVTDIFDTHEYEQDVEKFTAQYSRHNADKGLPSRYPDRQTYTPGMPYFVSEFGGARWSSKEDNAWGYGNAPRTKEEFLERLRGLTGVLLDNPNHFGFCYTQLYDVEQEQNGLYTYDRQEKFPAEVLREIIGRSAAIEG